MTTIAPVGLTRRQTSVLRMISLGDTDDEIAARLGISVQTVKCHGTALRKILGARSRSEAVAVAFRTGLLR